MPFFFIVPVWMLVVFVSVPLLFFRRLRFLSSYLVLSSTLGLLLSFLISLAFLLIAGKVFGNTSVAWIAILAYLAGMLVGGVLGFVAGLLLARNFNRRVGWQA
jgi:hypothetical protein